MYFTRYVLKIDHLSYNKYNSSVLLFFKLPSLADRGINNNLGFLSKLLYSKIDSPALLNSIHFKITFFLFISHIFSELVYTRH